MKRVHIKFYHINFVTVLHKFCYDIIFIPVQCTGIKHFFVYFFGLRSQASALRFLQNYIIILQRIWIFW